MGACFKDRGRWRGATSELEADLDGAYALSTDGPKSEDDDKPEYDVAG